MLVHSVKRGLEHEVSGETVREVLQVLFVQEPGLRTHLVDERGEIRPHVSIFVNGAQVDMASSVPADADIRVLHAVSGGTGLSTGDVEDRRHLIVGQA